MKESITDLGIILFSFFWRGWCGYVWHISMLISATNECQN